MSKITSIESFAAQSVCIVRVRSDDGLEGYGQTAPGQPGITSAVLHELITRNYLDKDPFDIAALSDGCVRAEYKFLGSFLFRALAGVDTALWDLLGRATGRPVYQLLGGQVRDRIPMYASGMRRDTTPEEEAARMVQAVTDSGFRCVKAKIGQRNGRDGEPFDGRTSALVPLLRKELGDSMEISADANGAYSPGQAVRVGRLLEQYGYYHLEEPNPCWELDNMGVVAAALDLPIGAGEQEYSLEIVRRMISERLIDVIQPDVCYMGGITRARKVAEMADIAGIPCTPHCSNQSMVQVFTAHFAAAMPACTQFQEWSIEGHVGGIYDPMPIVRDGFLDVGDRPGWGVDILQSFLDRADRQVSAA